MFEIREMTFDDIDEVVSIEKENFSVPWNENGFFSFMIREGTVFLAAESEGRIAGYGGMVTAADEGDITNVSVASDCRRQGIAEAIVERLIAEGMAMNLKKIFLEVRVSNSAAIALYDKCGFKPVGCRKNYYEDPIEDASVMLKEL